MGGREIRPPRRNIPVFAAAEGRTHFAGEHTSAWPGWIQGALHSGLRAAREVVAAG
jgi:monoamine oxidase